MASTRPELEICVDTLAAAEAADRGGADRIELCSALSEGGLTPSAGLIEQVLAAVRIPVFVMLRPRAGDFCYSLGELRAMERDIQCAQRAGAAGVVLGVLTRESRIDVHTTQLLVQQARPLQVTVHRAFDATADLEASLEAVIETGADLLLTSGGAPRIPEALSVVQGLVLQAGDRIRIMGGSGVTIANAAAVFRATGVAALHASLRRPLSQLDAGSRQGHLPGDSPAFTLHEEDVRAMTAALDMASR